MHHARSHIAISAKRDGRMARFTITDDGPGIPAERRDEMLARGARLDSASSGAGLGLAIVKDIAETWDATLSFEAGEHGFSVILTIPAVAADATVLALAKR